MHNANGNLRVSVDDATGVGVYAADGSLRVTVVDGTSYTGYYAADGSVNVVVVSDTDLPISYYHPCGAIRGVAATGAEIGYQAPNGAVYMDGLTVSGPGGSADVLLLSNGTDGFLLVNGSSFLLLASSP